MERVLRRNKKLFANSFAFAKTTTSSKPKLLAFFHPRAEEKEPKKGQEKFFVLNHFRKIIFNALKHTNEPNWRNKRKIEILLNDAGKKVFLSSAKEEKVFLCCLPFSSWKKWLIRGRDEEGNPCSALNVPSRERNLMNFNHVWLFPTNSPDQVTMN